MKRTLLPIACLAILAVGVFGQSDADYSSWMKTVGATSGSLRKSLDAKNKDAAVTDARRLQETFKQVHDYWQKKNVEDAMKLAMDAENAFKDVADQTAADKFEDAAASLRKASATCAGCHTAHRERAGDGSWKIK